MSDLDDKLREILILEVYFKDESTGGKELAAQTAIQQIKQVFVDHKYCYHEQMLLKQFLEIGEDKKSPSD